VRRTLVAIGTAVALAPAAACAGTTSRSLLGAAATATATASQETSARCAARRPPYGDVIFVWMNSIGGPIATKLPGGWVYNEATGTCQTTVAYRLNTTPTGPGNCVQVALVADNSEYDINAEPLPPLNKIRQSYGNCSAATQPATRTP
jgi:hypothetical protein